MMKKTIRKCLLVGIGVAGCVSVSTNAMADLDTWANDAVTTYNGPNYYESQERNMFSGGSFHLRNQNFGTEPIAGITLPRFNAGCGGIDMFWGGYNFMDFDYLVQKGQRIISAAPAFAFQYALNSVSPAVSTIMQGLENASNFLNDIQVNECGIAETAVDVLMPDSTGFQQKQKEQIEQWTTNIAGSSWYQNAQTILSEYDSNGGNSTAATRAANKQKEIDGCPAYLINLVENVHSMMSAANSAITYPLGAGSNYEQLIRGLVGDIDFQLDADNNVIVRHQKKCANTETDPIKSLQMSAGGGTPLQMMSFNAAGASMVTRYSCVNYPPTATLDTYTRNMLQSVYAAKQGGLAVPDPDKDFLALIPLPVNRFIDLAYISNAPVETLDVWVETINYGMLSELFASLMVQSEKIPTDLENTILACKEGNTEGCGFCTNTVHLKEVREEITKWREEVSRVQKIVEQGWIDKQENMLVAMSLFDKIDSMYINEKRASITGKERR